MCSTYAIIVTEQLKYNLCSYTNRLFCSKENWYIFLRTLQSSTCVYKQTSWQRCNPGVQSLRSHAKNVYGAGIEDEIGRTPASTIIFTMESSSARERQGEYAEAEAHAQSRQREIDFRTATTHATALIYA